jgi:prevent-host-death family protein
MERQIDITEARKQLASLVEQVKYQRDSYIIVRRGKPAAAIVPLDVYEQQKRERQQLFDAIAAVQAANPQADADQVLKDVLEAQQAVRSSQPQ